MERAIHASCDRVRFPNRFGYMRAEISIAVCFSRMVATGNAVAREGLSLRSILVPDAGEMPILGIFDHKPERLAEVEVESPDVQIL